jgi:hypothetical protein
MHLILDGVPNHTSSDSPFFDKYARHDTEGACESEAQPLPKLVLLRPGAPAGTGACAGDVNYRGWFNVATLPQLDTANEAVIDNWLGEEGIALKWLQTPGVDGWRIDVVPDVVRSTRSSSSRCARRSRRRNPTRCSSPKRGRKISRGCACWATSSTTMNYRFRLAVLGFLRDSAFDDNDGSVPPLTATSSRLRCAVWRKITRRRPLPRP